MNLPPLTWLYVPGDRPDRFDKALASGADAVIIDLEDAVAAPRKTLARDAAAAYLATVRDVPTYVRVNELDGPDAREDLAAVVGRPGLAGLRLPKVQDMRQVRALATAIADLIGEPPADAGETETHHATVPASFPPLHCLLESALGVENAHAIATAHPAVAGIGLGEADLTADLGTGTDTGLAYARGRVVTAARAAGLPAPAMSVYPHLTDLDGLAASTRAGRDLGFFGRTAIHPRQLDVIVEAFRPEREHLDKAARLLEAVTGAERRASGTAVLPDGRFADRAMVAAAERVVALAARYGMESR